MIEVKMKNEILQITTLPRVKDRGKRNNNIEHDEEHPSIPSLIEYAKRNAQD